MELLPRMEKVLVLLQQRAGAGPGPAEDPPIGGRTDADPAAGVLPARAAQGHPKGAGIAKDDRTAELDKFKSASKPLTSPRRRQSASTRRWTRLSMLETGSPEYRRHPQLPGLDHPAALGRHSQDKLDLKRARRVLDRDHYGLDDVKDRILEFLAVGIMKGEIAGSIILLVGPPGVGKTSIGRSIADALGRRFYRFSVGGIRDEAEIKGHRRTYIGAMPGKFIQAMKDAGTANPVIMLDEIDKIGASYHGDPGLGPAGGAGPGAEQRLPGPLSGSALRPVQGAVRLHGQPARQHPGPLLDRMEVINSPVTSPRRSCRSPRSICCRDRSSGPAWTSARSSSTPHPARDHRRLCAGRRGAPPGKAAGQDRAQEPV